MKKLFRSLGLAIAALTFAAGLLAQQTDGSSTPPAGVDNTTAAAAAVQSGAAQPDQLPEFVEHAVDVALAAVGVENAGNTWWHYTIAGLFLVVFYILRRVVARLIFRVLRHFTARTITTIDDELLGAVEGPVAAFISLIGAILAIKVLKLSPETAVAFRYLTVVGLSLVTLWFFLNIISAILDHLQARAKREGNAAAAFMPWIKKSVITLVLILGVLLSAQALGANVKAFLAGLGIGGLAFALAAQDTLANLFGSVVVAVDQPFRLGDFVRIGAHEGTVEVIGLRSTRLRTPDRSLITIPNKTVAAEAINNHSRITQRRVFQVIGITYSAGPDQIDALVADIRNLLNNEPEVQKGSGAVHFLNFNTSSLDIQISYYADTPDGGKATTLRHRMNLAIMRLVAARGLSFAFPTQTVELSGPVAERLAGRGGAGGQPAA